MIFMTVCSSLYITCGVRVVYQIIPDLFVVHLCLPTMHVYQGLLDCFMSELL